MRLNSTVRLVSDGTVQRVDLTYTVQDGDIVMVYFDDDEVESGWSLQRDTKPQRVDFQEPIPAGTNVLIRRFTDMLDLPHRFHFTGNAKGGAEFNGKNLDENFEKILRAAQDAMDSFELVGVNIQAAVGAKEAAYRAEIAANRAESEADRAKLEADRAESESDRAKSEATRAEAEADRAEQAASNVVGVVLDEIASLTPEAGKVPLAGADGKIHSGWIEIGSGEEIVSQEEAEEGTSTTPRKWTAQRVRQSYDAAWAESKEEFLSNSNIFRAGQGIWIEQGVENLLLATSDSPYTLIGFAVGMADPETAKAFYLGSDKDGNLVTLSEDGNLQPHRVWTSYSLPVRTMREIERYTGDGITLAQDARAALELGSPAPPTGNIFLPGVGTSDGILIPGRNLNITVKDVCVINTWPEKHGTGEFASITVRSDSTSIRPVFLSNSILNKSDFEAEYTVTDTEALYLEGRYVDSGFMITFLTKYTVPST